MFWRMTGLSATSPVDSILDKENYTIEELLDEDEIIPECNALNIRLINFLRDRAQVEKLLHYIVDETPEDAETKRVFKYPFIACEIFTSEVDAILKSLSEDEELMNLLFSFLRPNHSHSTLLAGYFSKVVICLMSQKTVPFMNYVQGHQEILHQLVDLIGITSIMEVLIHLVGADDSIYSNHADAMQWLESTNVHEMIVDKLASSDSPEVHANAAEILCAISRYAPSGLAMKIFSPCFIGRLLRHALEDSRPKSVLVHSLSVCICLLDPTRSSSASTLLFRNQSSLGPSVAACPERVDCMLERLGDLLKLLDVSSLESTMPTTYGKLQPPLGKHRLKIVELISVLLTIGSETAEKQLVQSGSIKCAFELFFEYPFNNFLHHHVENIIGSCLESKRTLLIEHLLHDCSIISKILAADKNPTVSIDSSKPTVSADGRTPPRVGNVGHLTRIANKLIQLGNSNSMIQKHLQKIPEWADWQTSILLKRNAVEDVCHWICGRPGAQQDQSKDSDDDDDIQERDDNVASLASNLSQAFQNRVYCNGNIEEDVYFDGESAEVVISSLYLGDDQESDSIFTNSNWFAVKDDGVVNDHSTGSLLSPSSEETEGVIGSKTNGLIDSVASSSKPSDVMTSSEELGSQNLEIGSIGVTCSSVVEDSLEWVICRVPSHSGDASSMPHVPDANLDPGEHKQTINGFATVEHEDKNGVGSSQSPGIPSEDVPESCDNYTCRDDSHSVEPVRVNGCTKAPK